MWGLSYWTLPLLASTIWLAMLLAMLLWWVTKGEPHLPAMASSQHIAYISDVGAASLKPLFIAMSTATVVLFDVGFIAERWLRHRGRLVSNTSRHQKALSILAIIFSIVGGAGLILLTIFDVYRHKTLHDVFLTVFIGGYILNAIFICAEYQRLGIHFREHRILRVSFWIKLFFILIEVVLAVAFGVTQRLKHYNVSAVLEWTVSLVFYFYVLSFFIDFIPAVRTKNHQSRETEEEMATAEGSSQQAIIENHDHGRYGGDGNGYANEYESGRHYAQPPHANGYTNGHVKPENGVLRAGQHF